MSFEHPADNKRCDHCNIPGTPYEYRDQTFSGLCAFEGEFLCPGCRDRKMDTEGVNILIQDDRASVGSFVYNTAHDADKIFIHVPEAMRGIDGRDMDKVSRSRKVRR